MSCLITENFRLSVLLLTRVLAILTLLNTGFAQDGVSKKTPLPDGILATVYSRYMNEVASGTNCSTDEFRAFWVSAFQKALESDDGNARLRLRMMDEMGALQRALGKHESASQTYIRMYEYAKEQKALASQYIALENRLSVFSRFPSQQRQQFLDQIKNVATELEQVAQQRASLTENNITLSDYANALTQIGVLFNSIAAESKDASVSQDLRKRSERAFERAAALNGYGTMPEETRLFWLAQTQASLGKREQAAQTYARILAIDQTTMSPLWIEYLRICETVAKDSPEYRTRIEKLLDEQKRQNRTDEYEATLRHELGLSYRNAKEYAKSTAVLSANIGKGSDDLSAHDMLLTARNYKASGDPATARGLLDDIIKRFPKTGSAQWAAQELKGPIAPVAVHEPMRFEKSRAWLITINVVLLVALIAVVVIRQWRKRLA